MLAVLSACSESVIMQTPDDGVMGSVSITLSADLDSDIVVTKADNLPDIDDFTVEIYKNEGDKIRLYRDSFANTKSKTIPLNAGEYRLVAQHGDTLGFGFGKAKEYYLADTVFNVTGPGEKIKATARLGNTKLAVSYDPSISEVYNDYKTIVKHNVHKDKSVLFSKGETRSAYIPSGDLILEIWADGKVYETAPYHYEPNDFVTFIIANGDVDGELSVRITIEDDPDPDNKDISIPAYAESQAAPSVVIAGFDEGVHTFIEGVSSGEGYQANFVARGALKNCNLTIDSEFLAAQGLPETLDFANLTSAQETKLKSLGFDWSSGMKGSRTFAYIDFSDVIDYLRTNIKATADDAVVAEFGLQVIDEVGKQSSDMSFSIVSGGITATLAIENYNVWAKKVVSPVATLSRGDMSLFKLQMSRDKSSWTDVQATPMQNGNEYTYDKVLTNPNTTYHFRSIYNNNPECASEIVTVTTEKAAQIGNSGFEDYQMVTTKFKPLAESYYDRNWYLPYAAGESDPWWACNSMRSMPDRHTGWSVTWCKNFPSSGYVKNAHSGSKAALLFCVNVGGTNTAGTAVETTYNGEIWLGTADNSGNQAVQGHSFTSRPSKLTFWYKYAPTDNKKFYVETWIKDAQGNVIASSMETAGSAASDWTKFELPFTYTNLEAKAASIYIWIASAYGEGSVDTGVTFDLGEESVKAHAGCFLTIDDMELIYE